MKYASNVAELIGNTPLLALDALAARHALKARVMAKLEYFNPAGSAKDRVALEMLDSAEREGRLKSGSTVIEPTSGNTGIALAAICAARGYKAIIIMPANMSAERFQLVRAYGAQLILSPAEQGMKGAVALAEELQKQIPDSIIAGQFVNPANPAAHRRSTGPEIWRDTDGRVDMLVAGIGTGGTITGTGAYLKSQNKNVRLVGVEPAESPLLTQGHAGKHGIQGIGANFVPDILDRGLLDEVMDVKTQDAIAAMRELAAVEGVLCGISSGAALWAAMQQAVRDENAGKLIVCVLPDTGERYLSAKVFD